MNKFELKNGDELILRNGETLYHLNGVLYRMSDKGNMFPISDSFNNDLTHVGDRDFDVMKVVYEDEIVFDRGVDWTKVAMGTPVIAWDNIWYIYEGKFVYYDANDDEKKYLVLVSYEMDVDGNTVEETYTAWFTNCKLKEGGYN